MSILSISFDSEQLIYGIRLLCLKKSDRSLIGITLTKNGISLSLLFLNIIIF